MIKLADPHPRNPRPCRRRCDVSLGAVRSLSPLSPPRAFQKLLCLRPPRTSTPPLTLPLSCLLKQANTCTLGQMLSELYYLPFYLGSVLSYTSTVTGVSLMPLHHLHAPHLRPRRPSDDPRRPLPLGHLAWLGGRIAPYRSAHPPRRYHETVRLGADLYRAWTRPRINPHEPKF